MESVASLPITFYKRLTLISVPCTVLHIQDSEIYISGWLNNFGCLEGNDQL